MKIHNKILSLLMAVSIIFSSAVPTYALSKDEVSLWSGFLSSSMTTLDEYAFSKSFDNKWSLGSGGQFQWQHGNGGQFQNAKWYTGHGGRFQGDKNSSLSSFNTGSTVTNTFLQPTYNNTTNNYSYTYNHYYDNDTYYNYDITEINYNSEYNTYEFVTNNDFNIYFTYSPTYVTVMYYDESTSQNIKNDYYYQLPDGRSSYDLTADEVWGTYFIYNAVNYDEVAEDDGKTLGLYHFDGDLKNSAAVNPTYTPTVSSLNYSTGKFDSAVVQTCVDRTYRSVSYVLPSNTVCVEFWAYFSSYTYDYQNKPVSYSTVQPDFLFSYLTDSTNITTPVSTDVWHHVLFRLYNNSVYVYLDGVQQSYTLKSIPKQLSSYCYTPMVDSSGSYVLIGSQRFGIDELRFSNCFPYSSNTFTPRSQPFDTNLVLVLPETGNTNDIAVKSNTPVSTLRVGGVRPTIPTNGYVYVYLEDDVVKDIQQYQTDGWYSVDASIYEDDTWVTLKDKDLSSYSITEEDFPTVSPTPTPDNPSDGDDTGDNDNTGDEDETTGILASIMEKITGFFTGLLDILFGGILDLITVITDNLTGIIDGFTGITGLIGALFGFLPEQMISVLTSGLAVIIVVVIIKILI